MNEFNEMISRLEQKNKLEDLAFEEFLSIVIKSPQVSLRNIFQLIFDMLEYYVQTKENKFPNDPMYLGLLEYDYAKLFIEDCNQPFFADQSLMNNLIQTFRGLKEKTIVNKMFLFQGPPGSGKSIFLTNLLEKLESYSKLEEGAMWETVWKGSQGEEKVEIVCPSHDHPLLQIPKEFRKGFIDGIIKDGDFKEKLFNSKEFAWVWEKTPCVICQGIFKSLSKSNSVKDVFKHVYAKRFILDRKTGDGITIYNPSDEINFKPVQNKDIQKKINRSFGLNSVVPYVHSDQAKTNNGVFAIMDVKANNNDRLSYLHGLISDGVHKVGTYEEEIDSCFMTLGNPENLKELNNEKSYSDRLFRFTIPYVKSYKIETEIYKHLYEKGMEKKFMPLVLGFFAKIIISTRLREDSSFINGWFKDKDKYLEICDSGFKLLKTYIYADQIPIWLEENDKKNFTKKIKQDMIEHNTIWDGLSGFSGRESIEIFHSFISSFKETKRLITLTDVLIFFRRNKMVGKVSLSFLETLVKCYNYIVYQQIKEAMFYYNDDEIKTKILNYLYAINCDNDATVVVPSTGETINVTDEYFRQIEEIFLNKSTILLIECRRIRTERLKQFVSKTLQEVRAGKKLEETEMFKTLFKAYKTTLKKKVLEPFVQNVNFKRAIEEYNTDGFKNYDEKIRNKVTSLIINLQKQFEYTEEGAKTITLYVLEGVLSGKIKEMGSSEPRPALKLFGMDLIL